MPQKDYNPSVHWLALVTAAATFPLIFMGGLVTSHGAGMSVPDWPNSWGYNMFTFPPSKWVGGILFEHTHRLAGAFVGLLTVALVAVTWATDRRRWLRWTAVAVLLAVCLQGTIGGLRVVLSQRDLAIIHGIAAQLFFCFIAAFCVMTSRFWAERRNIDPSPAIRKVLVLSLITVAVLLAQLIVGAIMRHSDAGLAIPDFPTSYGHLFPPTRIDAAFRQEAIHQFGTGLGLNRVTLFQIWIHFAHRIGATLVTISVIALAAMILLPARPAGIRPPRLRGSRFARDSSNIGNSDRPHAETRGHRIGPRRRGSAFAGDDLCHRHAGARNGPVGNVADRIRPSICGDERIES